MNVEPIQDKPQDLSMNKSSTIGNSNKINADVNNDVKDIRNQTNSSKNRFPTTVKKVKPIPPPLDLAACNLDNSNDVPSDLRTPKSPGDLPRECLPLRKRPLLDGRRDLHTKSPKSAGPQDVSRISFSAVDFRNSHVQPNTAPSSPTVTSINEFLPSPSTTTAPFSLSVPYHNNHHPTSFTLTPSSASSLSAFSPFSNHPHLQAHHVPPLIPPPGSGSSHAMAAATAMAASAIAAAAAASYSPKSPFTVSQGGHNSGYPTPPTELSSAYPWASPSALSGMFPTPFSPVMPISPLPFTSSSMLSPAPSHPSSTNSSREELPLGASGEDAKRRYLSATINHGSVIDSLSPLPSSPLMSPLVRSQNWPVPSWQCFLAGSRIRFLLPNTNTPWQKAEELGWKDKIALKVDSRNPYQFAPNGLTVLKIDIVTTDTIDAITQSSSSSLPSVEGGESSKGHTVLLLRMGAHRVDNAPDILADCPIDHPFFVKDKGWSSAQSRLTFEKFGIPCRELSVGDVCLPPDHQEAVRTPDLCDRFRRFEFSTGLNDPSSPLSRVAPILPRPVALHHQAISNTTTDGVGNNIHVGGNKNIQSMSPPISPAHKKEKEKGADKPKRPMNGFMLFAKKYRLELIQQHPGKDNRAISVLLGEAWKGLALEEREQYSQRAKTMADEQKKIFPDCWKRKRTLTSTSASTSSSSTSISSKTTQLLPTSSGLETTQTSLMSPTAYGTTSYRSSAPSCISGTSSSTNIIVKTIKESNVGSDMIQQLGNSRNIDITVPK